MLSHPHTLPPHTPSYPHTLTTPSLTVPSIEVFLNATQTAASEVMLNISAFVSENSRIVAEIDSLIASLDDIHSRINRVGCG